MQETTTRKIYNVQSMFYDRVAARIVCRRQSQAIDKMDIQAGHRILDLGVGTGLSLARYPNHCSVVGVDLSAGMLGKARLKVSRMGAEHIQLVCGDAMNLPFAENQFDSVLVSHVISVVSDPVKLIDAIRCVVRPKGRIVIINHFQSTHRVVGMVEKLLCPLCERMGWKSDLSLHELLTRTRLNVDFRYKLEPLDLWETIFATNA